MQIINPSAGGLYNGLSHAVSTIYRLEGLRTLWRGMTSVIVGAGARRHGVDVKNEKIPLTLVQVPRMPFTLAHMKSSRNLLVAIRQMANTTR